MAKDVLKNWLNKPLTLWSASKLLLAAVAVWGIIACWPKPKVPVRPVILLINHYPFTPQDTYFYKQANPFGFLLGIPKRENLDPRILRLELAEALGRNDFLFFIDQEGGSVNRLKQFFPQEKAPSPAYFGKLAAKDEESAAQEAYQYGLSVGKKLKELTVDVVFGPNAEVLPEGEDYLFRSRYYSSSPQIVKRLADAYAAGLAQGGVIPCYKHAVGASGLNKDPHLVKQEALYSVQEIREIFLPPFQNASRWPFLMTAHVLYPAIDAQHVSTYSPAFYRFVREELNFNGLIIPDALNMEAADQDAFVSVSEQMNKALAAGADVVIPFFNVDANPAWILKELEAISPAYVKRLNKKWSALRQEAFFQEDFSKENPQNSF